MRDGSANFRVGTNRDSRVSIKIIDRAGRQIDELLIGDVRAGIPTEQVWRADLSSGIYFARVLAIAVDGSEEMTVVKVAVIR
jgi:hypothetical protein